MQALFNKDIILTEHKFNKSMLWSSLDGNIFKNTLHFIADEEGRVGGCGIYESMDSYVVV